MVVTFRTSDHIVVDMPSIASSPTTDSFYSNEEEKRERQKNKKKRWNYFINNFPKLLQTTMKIESDIISHEDRITKLEQNSSPSKKKRLLLHRS